MNIFNLKLPIYEKMVLLFIRELSASHSNVFPDYETIAAACGMSKRKAIYVVKHLIEAGLLTKEFREKIVNGERKQTSNTYELNPSLEHSAPHAPAANDASAYHAPYKALNSLNKEEDIYIPFENEILRYKIPKSMVRRILNEVNDIHTYSAEAIRRSFKKAMNRVRVGGGLYNFPKWLATTLRNEQFYLDQRAFSV